MFKLKIETGGSAYRENDRPDPCAWEIRRNLADISDRLACGVTSGKIIDINGNAVGAWKYKED